MCAVGTVPRDRLMSLMAPCPSHVLCTHIMNLSCSGCLHLALRDIPVVFGSSSFQHTRLSRRKKVVAFSIRKSRDPCEAYTVRCSTGNLPLGLIWIAFQAVFRIWMLLQSKYLYFIFTLLDKGKLRDNVAGYSITLSTPKLHYLLEKPTSSCAVIQP